MFPNLHSISYEERIFPESLLAFDLKNLKELNIDLFEENQHLFPEVLQKFQKIRHLSLESYHSEQSVFDAFKESPVLQNLIELTYKYSDISIEKVNPFLDSLRKFPKLKSISFGKVWVKDFSDLGQHLSPLKAFLELKRLNLELLFETPQNVSEFSLMPFEELQNITHLSLVFDPRSELNEKILTNIDILLPKLQYLCINPMIITDEEGVEQMTESLSKLSSLQTINFAAKIPSHY